MKKDIEWLVQMINAERETLRQRIETGRGTPNENTFNEGRDRALAYVLKMIDHLDKPEVLSQELPVIPKYVAEWIIRHRDIFDIYPALRRLESNSLTWEQIYKWYRMNTHKFVNAYLTGEYEVEEEPLYYALVKGHELIADKGDWTFKYWKTDTSDGRVFPSHRLINHGDFLIEMSKEDWNVYGINDTNADFVKVDE